MRKTNKIVYLVVAILLLLSSFSVPVQAVENENSSGTVRITTTPAGADVYIDGERYVQKCTPCTIPLDEGNYEIKLVIKGYEDCTNMVQVNASEETVLEPNLLPEVPNETAKVITVTTEEDPEEDNYNTSVTYDDLESMENVSLRMAANVVNNDETSCWYRIEFAEGVNHIEPVNHTLEFTRGNLIINGDKDRNGTPDVQITKSYWNVLFFPMDNLYIMGLKIGSEDTNNCPISIRPNDYCNVDVSFENVYVLGCSFINCEIIPFCGGCKVYNSTGKVDYTNINACGNTLVNSNLFFSYSGNIDNSTADGVYYCANTLDDRSLISPQCVDCNTNYIYGPDTEAANGGTPGAYETSDNNTVKNYLVSGNYGGRLVCSAAVLGNNNNHLINVDIRNNIFTDYAFIRVCQPLDERNVGYSIDMNNNSIENLKFEYNVLVDKPLYICIAAFDAIDDSTSYQLNNNVMKNVKIANNLYIGNDYTRPEFMPREIEYELNGGIIPAGVFVSNHEDCAKNVELTDNRFEGLVFENNKRVTTYDSYDIWDDSIMHEHEVEWIDSVDSTETEYGAKGYWHCTGCNKYYEERYCETEISDLEHWLQNEGRIDKKPSVEHTYGTYWVFDETNHWHECSICGDKTDTAAHTNTTTTTKATLTANGKKVTKCSVCGKSTTTTIYYPKTFTLAKTSCEYTGSQIKPTITITDSNGKTVAATNYTVAYGTNKAVGKGTVKVTFKGDYSGTKSVEFNITPKKTTIGTPAIAADGITVKWTANTSGTGYYIYRSVNGADYTKVKTITSNATVSWKDTGATTNGAKYQYKIYSYKTVDGTTYKSPVSSVKTIYFLTKPTVSSAVSASDGITVKWVKNSKATGYYIYRSVNGADYTKVKTVTSNATVSWKDTGAKTNGTKYQYKIYAYKTVSDTTYKSVVSAVKTTYFVNRPTISSLTAGTKAFTVKWGKNSKATGYQIQYSTTSDFSSGNKTVTVTSASTVSKTVSSLTAKKKYYVRIRTYKTVSGTKYYSAWSASKAITTK